MPDSQYVKDTLNKYDLNCWAISNHLAGQCVADTLPDAYDSRLDGFAPSELAGKPEEIRKWAVQEMKYTAHAAKAMGVDVVTEACAFTKKINFSPSNVAFDDAIKNH